MKLQIELTGERPAGNQPGYYDPSMTTPVEASLTLETTETDDTLAAQAESFLTRHLAVEELPAAARLRVQLTEQAAELDRVTTNEATAKRRRDAADIRIAALGTDLAGAMALLVDFQAIIKGSGLKRPAGFTARLKALQEKPTP